MLTISGPVWRWDPWKDVARLRRDAGSLLERPRLYQTVNYPPMNIFVGVDDVIVTAEIPGIDPNDVELTVTQDRLNIKGTTKALEEKADQKWHRRERGFGSFHRTVELPFNVDGNKVHADYNKGVLTIVLPRSEADKPRKISVKSEK